jgi:tetratricopeptide (TPR) repeat protein
VQNDDRLALEFSGPAGLFISDTARNVSALRALRTSGQVPVTVAHAVAHATAAEWSHRGALMARISAYDEAFENYRTALALHPADADAPRGLVSVAIAAHRESEAVSLLKALASADSGQVQVRIALSRLLAARGEFEQAIAQAAEACRAVPSSLAAWEQLASIFSDAGEAERLDAAVDSMRNLDPKNAVTLYYTGASHFLHGRLELAVTTVQQAIAADPRHAAAYNLLGATYASLGNVTAAREAFTTAIGLDPRDSATYTNLALLELNAHNPSSAGRWFAEALSLDPTSTAAREGLAQARNAVGQR